MTNSHFIPTPGIENVSNTIIVQRLIHERIRSTLQDENMVDNAEDLTRSFLTIPPTLENQEEITDFIKKQSKAIVKVFQDFEKTAPGYAEAIRLLKDLKNKCFRIISTTYQGIYILIEDA